jgi:hypothetical protein
MKRNILLLVLLLTASLPALAQTSPAVAFVNVNVIPMDRERLLRNQTVVVHKGMMVQVGDTKHVRIAPGVQRNRRDREVPDSRSDRYARSSVARLTRPERSKSANAPTWSCWTRIRWTTSETRRNAQA